MRALNLLPDLRFALRTLRRSPLFTAVAALAGLIPAHRASRIDPILALRYE